MSKDLYSESISSYEEMMDICRRETRRLISETIRLCLPFADTPEGRVLMEEQLYGVLIQMLTYVQVNTKRIRKERQKECIDSARANGVHFGRRKKYIAEDYADVFIRLQNGEIDRNTACAEIGTSQNTFGRLMKDAKEKGII